MATTPNNTIANLLAIGTVHRDDPRHSTLARASVLVPLFYRRGPSQNSDSADDDGGSGEKHLHVLLTQRPQSLSSHPGEVCFPGGRQDPDDENDDVATALREANEEVGLDPKSVTVVCRLGTIESRNGLCVTPIVGCVCPPSAAEPSRLKLSLDEVEAAFAVPLSYFLEEKNCASIKRIEWRGSVFDLRTYHFQAECGRRFKIWGLTAGIAYEVARIAFGGTKSWEGAESWVLGPKNDIREQARREREQWSLSLPRRSGYLLRLVEGAGSSGISYWSRSFFVVTDSGSMLHQFENALEATREEGSATKKNRLPLNGCKIFLPPPGEDARPDMHIFIVRALEGRLQWRLAAESEVERDFWRVALLQWTRSNTER